MYFITNKLATASHLLCLLSLVIMLTACAPADVRQTPLPYEAIKTLADITSYEDQELFIHNLYYARSWVPYRELPEDPIAISQQSKTPIKTAYTKIIGPSYQDSIRSLAAKLWMIEHAEHTLDLTYYIFQYDPTGQAILGALCNAVRRGVDIRIMVDSIGSFNISHKGIMALETCAENAGYIRDANGKESDFKARVQFVVINALTSPSSWSNRRSHDKLIIKDGSFPGKDITITGGRNISVDYYGINKDGSRNPNTYMDLEIVLRDNQPEEESLTEPTVGDVSSVYYSLLFLHRGNRRVHPFSYSESADPFAPDRTKAQQALAFIKSLPAVSKAYEAMPVYLTENFHTSDVRLAHELGNLISEDVVTNVAEIKSRNSNSIDMIFSEALEKAEEAGSAPTRFRVVSPYLFIPQYKDSEGEIIHDGAAAALEALEKHPSLSIEIITNSVLTSDNFFTQSVIDMDTAPRLLLTPDIKMRWLASAKNGEFNPEFINSREWRTLINHPRIKIYQTGKLDSVLIGGDREYGKLHAKFFFDDTFGFVGTSNFDYRSRLYNNEMGFYYVDRELSQNLNDVFEALKAISLRWGSDEWLKMRRELIESGGHKGFTTSTQRFRYKFLKKTGLIWFF